MKPRHVEAERSNARATLINCGIAIGASYLDLKPRHIDALRKAADQDGYQKPAGANKARVHCFHDLLQRRAQL